MEKGISIIPIFSLLSAKKGIRILYFLSHVCFCCCFQDHDDYGDDDDDNGVYTTLRPGQSLRHRVVPEQTKESRT